MDRLNIVIIGGGYCGTIVSKHLASVTSYPIKIIVLDKRAAFHRGVAYGTDDKYHLLNVPHYRMSAVEEDPESFTQWLRNTGHFVIGKKFYARSVYGEYLNFLFQESFYRAGNGSHNAEVELIPHEALELKPGKSGRINVVTETNQEIVADYLVLALGGPPSTQFQNLKAYKEKRFIKDIWSFREFEDLAESRRVVILGSGLSMIDTVLKLQSCGFAGKIHAISRRGLIPKSHVDDSVPEVFVSIPISLSPLRALRWIRNQARNASERGKSWHSVVDSFRPYSNRIWASWNTREKRQFLRHLKSYWDVHRHRMAPEIEFSIQDLQNRKKLEIISGRIGEIEYVRKEFAIRFTRRGRRVNETLYSDYVIDCSGPTGNLNLNDNPLLSSLKRNFGLKEDSLKMGIAHSQVGRVICDRKFDIYCLGPIRKGILWETTAVPELRKQAKEVADEIAKNISQRITKTNEAHLENFVAPQVPIF